MCRPAVQHGGQRMTSLGRATPWIYPVLLAALVLAVFSPTLRYDFAPLDDDVNRLFNPHLGPPTLARLEWALTDPSYTRRYQPLGWITDSVVSTVSGISPWGYHGLNVVLHALNAVLLFRLLCQLLTRLAPATPRSAPGDWLLFAPLLSAAWWALNPLRVEIVAWCSGLPVNLAMTFVLLALGWHLRDDSPGRRWLAGGAFALGLLSYPVGMGATAFFPLLDWATGVRGRRLIARTLPYVLVSLVIGYVNLAARAHAGAEQAPLPTLAELPASFRLLRGFAFVAHYWWKPWLPFDLAPVYRELFHLPWLSAPVIGGTGLLVAAVAAAWRWRGVGLLLLAHFAVLLPITGYTELIHFPHDRYALWSDLAFATGLAFLLWRWQSRAAGVALGAIIAGCTVLTIRQLPVWQSTATVMASVRSHLAPGEAPAIRDIRPALWLFRAGDYTGAENLLDHELSTRPHDPDLRAARLDLRDLRAGHEKVVASFGLHIEDVPPAALLHQNLALGFLHQGEPEPAAWHLAEIARIAPAYYAYLAEKAAVRR